MLFNDTSASSNHVKVKICGICDSSIARCCVEQGADAIGLMFYPPSPRSVSLEKAAVIAEDVSGTIDIIGVFVNPDKEEVDQVLDKVKLTGLQFHGNETEIFCSQWLMPWLKAVHLHDNCDIMADIHHWNYAFACLLDNKTEGLYGGSGKAFDWSRIPVEVRQSIILSGGLHSGNVAEAIRTVSPLALDVSSGVERIRGKKSITLIKEFMHEVTHAQDNR